MFSRNSGFGIISWDSSPFGKVNTPMEVYSYKYDVHNCIISFEKISLLHVNDHDY